MTKREARRVALVLASVQIDRFGSVCESDLTEKEVKLVESELEKLSSELFGRGCMDDSEFEMSVNGAVKAAGVKRWGYKWSHKGDQSDADA